MTEDILFEEVVQPGAGWSHVVKRGTAVRLTDVQGGANVGALFYNFQCPVERLNVPDSLKAQHISRLTEGNVLYSDMGRILCSITADSVGWHDPLSGASNGVIVEAKYGKARYQEHRNDFHKNARDGFLIELAKYGLGPRDLSANINFFSKVTVNHAGDLVYVTDHSRASGFLELRFEMNVLVVLNSCQHPLDPNPNYDPKPVLLTVKRVPQASTEDACRQSCPENGRGFVLTERYFM